MAKRRNTRTDIKIAYQILKKSDRSNCQEETDPWESFPEQFNELAPQYKICTDNTLPEYDQASYDFMKERVMIVLTKMIEKRAIEKLRPPKTAKVKKTTKVTPTVAPLVVPKKGIKKWRAALTQNLF